MGTIPPSEAYEAIVRDLAERLVLVCKELRIGQVRGGRTNKMDGASGFSHQIDVSIHFSGHLVLLECKRLLRRVEVHHALTFASRLRDIQDANPSIFVSGSLVSMQPVRIGAIKIADYFGFRIDQVMSLNEYVMTIVDNHFAGVRSGLVIKDRAIAHVIQDGS